MICNSHRPPGAGEARGHERARLESQDLMENAKKIWEELKLLELSRWDGTTPALHDDQAAVHA
jgi:hypothetical protein